MVRLNVNDLSGSIPVAFGASNALRRVLSVNLEDNPSLCGDVPRGLGVDWRWQLDNQEGTSRDWFGFCQKDACGVFVRGGAPMPGFRISRSVAIMASTIQHKDDTTGFKRFGSYSTFNAIYTAGART